MNWSFRLYATCDAGVEPLLQAELEALGASEVRPEKRGVAFAGDLALVWRANLALRTANRVLLQLARFRVRHRDDLYNQLMDVPWEAWFGAGETIAVDTRTSHRALHNPPFVSQLAKDAICDRLRREIGQRPSVDRVMPDVPIALHLTPTHCTVSLDSSGARLHRRGYRERTGEAPLKETLAAAMLAHAGWTGETPLLDPMCGSGTIVIEAALLATNTPPGLLRIGGEGFAFERWQIHDSAAFSALVQSMRDERTEARFPIIARDIDRRVLKVARANAGNAGVASAIRFEPGHAGRMQPPCDPGTMISNPPYGERLGEHESALELMEELGSVMKHRFAGWTAWLLIGDKHQLGAVGLRPSRKIPLFNGPLECRLARFEMYEGTRRYGNTEND